MKNTNSKTRLLAVTAMLSAVAFLLAFLEFSTPLAPSFIKMDLSDFPALIGAFAFGPLCGVLVQLVKNALGLFSTSTGGVGELANFIMGGACALTAGLIYKHHKTKKGAWLAVILSSLVRGIVAAFTNYFILLPLYEGFMPLDKLIATFSQVLPFIKTKIDIVLYSALPFNILKGLIAGLATMPIYKRLSSLLKGKK